MDISSLVKKFSDFNEAINDFRVTKENESQWQKTTKSIYDFIKTEEKELGFPSTGPALPKLHIQNMTSEQIWQQMELQNETLIPDYNSLQVMNDSSLCVMVARLSTKMKEEESEEEDISQDEGVETGLEDSDEDISEMDDENEDLVKDDEEDEGQMEDDENESDLSDLDADTFGDIAQEGDESTDEDEEQNTEEQDDVTQNSDQDMNEPPPKESNQKEFKKKFRSTNVDSKFLSVRESEFVADNDLLGESKQLDDVDMMQEDFAESDEGEDEGAESAMYNAFFDQGLEPEEEQEEGNEEDDEVESENLQKPKSGFEESMARDKCLQEDLEDEFFVEEKPWILKGEVTKEQRPENSTLEEPLEYLMSTRQKPIITEETSKNIERLLLSRIRNQAWDDVERKIKPQVDPFKYKEKLILDQEKSKKSIAAIYEEEFLRKNAESSAPSASVSSILGAADEKVEEKPIHKEIREAMDELFLKLDILSNYHYTPKQKDAEIKVISNLPSVAVEEATPTIASGSTLLAPQEIVAPQKGDLKAESEKTSTDKNRQRRTKKVIQRKKAQRQEQKLREQLKTKKSKDGLLTKDTSVQLVQKAFKKGQIKSLEKEEKSSKSSTSFFKQFQENMNQSKKRPNLDSESGQSGAKKKKKSGNLTISQLML